jgi:peptide/nickel transport system substrate-binding protein
MTRAPRQRPRHAALALALAVASIVVSCGPDAAPGEIVLAVESPPLTLDPRGAFNADTAHIQQLIFNTLVTKGPDFGFAPELAVSWRVAPDLLTHDFDLRPGVTFHDGRPLTAADVAYTFNSLAGGSFAKSANCAALERVEAVDALSVRFTSKRPNPGLLVDLVAVGILPQGSGAEAATSPVGTGPFRVVSYDRDSDLRLEAFGGYFGGKPSSGSMRVRFVADPGTRAAALEAGEVDVAINTYLGPELLEQLGRAGAPTRVLTSRGGGIRFVALNTEAGPLANLRVRRALALALDRKAIAAALLGGRATLASGPLPPGHWAHAEAPGVPYDPESARRLLREAGGAGPTNVELMVLPTRADVTLASVLQESWRRIGVETTISAVEPAVFFERLTNGDFGAALHAFTGGNQFTTIFKGAFHSRSIHRRGLPGGELNYARFADPALDVLIERADVASDPGEQARLYADVQRRVAEAAPWVFLWHPDNTAVVGPRVRDFELNRGGDFYALRPGLLVAPLTP